MIESKIMKEKIAYILYSKDKNDSIQINNDRFHIDIIRYNPKKSNTFLIGKRFNVVYCDMTFLKISNK